ncbi:GNAT family N-acetyltransferase [Metasolibacillus fluoroglycofenilyticus]|uniref:GNAT family N-acetyltransferase n=1 Tax=Metasolibacillus TaxID=2703677 RepID=UPI000D377A55
MDIVEFTLVNHNGHLAYEYEQNGERLAEITWSERDGVMHMDHTYVSDQLRGQGVAKKLLDKAADYARENNLKMHAICSYVVASFEKSDAYNDVKA